MEEINKETITCNREDIKIFIENIIATIFRFENEKLGLYENNDNFHCTKDEFENEREELSEQLYEMCGTFLGFPKIVHPDIRRMLKYIENGT